METTKIHTEEIYRESLQLHEDLGGKLEVRSKFDIVDKEDLSLVYTPGVAKACLEIAGNPHRAYDLTIKKNCIAIVSDGSAVLGLGNIGPLAAIPVMEGKAMLFKKYGDVDAFPICVATQDAREIIQLIKNIAPVFAGVNLEDIAAPKCFEIEDALQNLGIPVFHDDQHGTAIVLLAALINAAKLAGKELHDLKVVINGAGAAGTAIAELLLCVGHDPRVCEPVRDIIVCDSRGIIDISREDIALKPAKVELAKITNKTHRIGTLADALQGADVLIGVSTGNCVTGDMIRTMADRAIVFAMSNPTPEIMPDIALKAGAFIAGTGRSDLPNQVNNALAFPGIFRGALDAKATKITNKMKLSAAYALAECVEHPTREEVIPSTLDKTVAMHVAEAVRNTCKEESWYSDRSC
ncbi:MAG TPA: NADP-dependent malic enzyme [Patescibacteria group bacterium]|nr:NADP-dependent malic enzyme [Patescibacteria group bacterium]